jgi:two-component system, cell cycle sensor histidine kinase and response regulator CckA
MPKVHCEALLLAENETMILDVSREMLVSLGYAVLTANMLGNAFRLAKTHTDEICLMISDVSCQR